MRQLCVLACLCVGLGAQRRWHRPLGDTSGMNEEKRDLLLKLHNDFRLQAAKGSIGPRYWWRMQPKAANMFELEYDLNIEKSAQEWAEKCYFDFFRDRRNPYGENLAWESRNLTTLFETWTTKEPFVTVDYTKFDWRTAKRQKALVYYTQIVWAETKRVGCGYKVCDWDGIDVGFLVCRYDPRGNKMDHPIFDEGKPCEKCHDYDAECAEGEYEGLCTPR